MIKVFSLNKKGRKAGQSAHLKDKDTAIDPTGQIGNLYA
jgi:hypothetical protein